MATDASRRRETRLDGERIRSDAVTMAAAYDAVIRR
jgi:hypothetical protein